MKAIFRSLMLASLVLFIGAATISCAEEEPLSENQIIDDSGLTIVLEWSTGGSSTTSLEEVDLDLDLVLGTDRVASSSSSFSFESVELESFFADGTYNVDVEYFSGTVAVDYTLFVEGTSSGRVLEYNGSFEAGDDDLIITDIRITKEGNNYLVVD